jgi:hypothetical protein
VHKLPGVQEKRSFPRGCKKRKEKLSPSMSVQGKPCARKEKRSFPRVCLCRESLVQEKKSDAAQNKALLPEHPFGVMKPLRGCRLVKIFCLFCNYLVYFFFLY